MTVLYQSGPSRKAGEDSGKEAGDGFTSGFGRGVTANSRGLGAGLTKALRTEFGLSATTLATGFSAQFIGSVAAGLASGVAKIAHGVGAVAALLPAAALSGVLAFGALKVALSGVGDALSAGLTGDAEEFQAAIEGLSPSAQEFARSVRGMKDELDGLRNAVQESFFAPWVDAVRPLADTYLPIVQNQLDGISNIFGRAVADVAGWLLVPEVSLAIAGAMNQMSLAVGDVARGLPNLVQAFLPLVTVGASFLPGLTFGFSDLTARVRDFMVEAERTGRLREFISGGLSAIGDLVDTAQQLGRIFGNVGAVVGQLFSGVGLTSGGLLDSLEGLTERMQAFFESASGGGAVSQIQSTVGAVISSLFGTLQRLGGIIGDAFGPHLPKILKFVEAFANLKSAVLGVGLDALEPILKTLGNVLGNVVLPALTGLATFLTENKPVLQGIGIAILAYLAPAFLVWAVNAGLAAVATIAAMLPIILLGAAIAALAALFIIHFDTIKSVVMTVFNWIQDNWRTLLVILTGPIGLAVLFVVDHFETIKNAVMTAFNWVQDNWHSLLGILTGPIGFAVGFIVSNFDAVVAFVAGLPGRIASAASGMWDGITGAFKSAINTIIGWWNGLAFPSFTLPSVSVPGLGSFGGQTFGGWSIRDIPYLHAGGTFKPPPGQTEGLAMLSAGEVFTPEQMAAVESRPNGAQPATRVVIDLTGGDSQFMRWMRNRIRVEGGNVQNVLGPGTAL